MGSDRARLSYDPKQQYRSVVMQQGRVTLEADFNEELAIAGEELREETLDIVGPSGTPDNGYLITPLATGPFDFAIGAGTMYVGGLRVATPSRVPPPPAPAPAPAANPAGAPAAAAGALPALRDVALAAEAIRFIPQYRYFNQQEWLDHADDPDWIDVGANNPPTTEFVYLFLREQEVSAVEDSDLKDVALGGPDTAQRTRLLQHIVRLSVPDPTCIGGLDAANKNWKSEGLRFNPQTMRLESIASLKVGFLPTGPKPDLCNPQAQGGYLGADNQLIRVQISGTDKASGNPKFVWGFDDASFLYRLDLDSNNKQLLHLQSRPVDASHQPQAQQAVEVLRSAAELSNGEYVASLSGVVLTLDKAYNPDTQMITLPAPMTQLPAEFYDITQTPRAFLRVWEQEIIFTPGTAVSLGNTGLQVTLHAPGNVFHTGDYWLFAVRPSTPQEVYPERYRKAFQPPDGPRMWVCPLGVITWNGQKGNLAEDCRNFFDNLVNLTKRQEGCCTITVKPQDLTGQTTLQSIINKASRPTMVVQAANPGAPGNNISVQISNVNLNVNPPTFDLTVIETDLYLGLTVAGSFNGIEGILGDDEGGPNDGLAHVLTGSVQPKLAPLDNQTVTFQGGNAKTQAQANFMDATNQQVVFTLQARNVGADGNVTKATISNVSGNPATFDLAVTWQRSLPGLSMATLFSSIQKSLGYLIVATPPTSVAPSFPAAGATQLSGGAEGNPTTGTGPATAQATIFGNPVTICLRPGSYLLAEPLVLGPEQSNIAIEACGGGATLSVEAKGENLRKFVLGMVQLNGANNVTFQGLTFAMPSIVFFQSGSTLAGLNQGSLTAMGENVLISLDTSVAMMVTGCAGLTVENCRFQFPGIQLNEVLFAAGIFAGADCADITLKDNLFEGPATLRAVQTAGSTVPAFALSAGYIQADSLQSLSTAGSGAVNGGTLIPSTLDNIVLESNSFENLAFPVMIITALGAAKFEGNIMRSCLTGFTILPLIAGLSGVNRAVAGDATTAVLSNSAAQRMLSIAVAFPRPDVFVPTRQIELAAPKAAAPAARTAERVTQPKTAVVNRVPTAVLRVALPQIPAAPASTQPTGAANTATFTNLSSQSLKLQNLTPLSNRVAQFMTNIGAAEIGITKFNRSLNFSVQFSDNDVDAFVPAGGGLWALSVLDLAALIQATGGTPGPNTETTRGTLTLTGNKFRSLWSGILSFAVSLMVDFCAVTGNVILNQAGDRGGSLAIAVFNSATPPANVAIAAITGNVLVGRAALPPRVPASLPEWTTYNDNR